LEDVNHLDLVGWVNTARYKWAELTGKSIRFKPASFYLEVAARLAEEVEGITWDEDDTNVGGYGHSGGPEVEHRAFTQGLGDHKEQQGERPHMRNRGSSKSKKRISVSVDLTKPKKDIAVPC
jgi:Mn-dependent DtxR family transcriptional regulator